MEGAAGALHSPGKAPLHASATGRVWQGARSTRRHGQDGQASREQQARLGTCAVCPLLCPHQPPGQPCYGIHTPSLQGLWRHHPVPGARHHGALRRGQPRRAGGAERGRRGARAGGGCGRQHALRHHRRPAERAGREARLGERAGRGIMWGGAGGTRAPLLGSASWQAGSLASRTRVPRLVRSAPAEPPAHRRPPACPPVTPPSAGGHDHQRVRAGHGRDQAVCGGHQGAGAAPAQARQARRRSARRARGGGRHNRVPGRLHLCGFR